MPGPIHEADGPLAIFAEVQYVFEAHDMVARLTEHGIACDVRMRFRNGEDDPGPWLGQDTALVLVDRARFDEALQIVGDADSEARIACPTCGLHLPQPGATCPACHHAEDGDDLPVDVSAAAMADLSDPECTPEQRARAYQHLREVERSDTAPIWEALAACSTAELAAMAERLDTWWAVELVDKIVERGVGAESALVDLAETSHGDVWAAAVRGLSHLGSAAIVPRLALAGSREDDEDQRELLAVAIGEIARRRPHATVRPGAEATALAALLDSAPDQSCIRIIGILGRAGDPAAQAMLIDCMTSGSRDVRLAAIEALEGCGDVRALGPLGEVAGRLMGSRRRTAARQAIQAITARNVSSPVGGVSLSEGGNGKLSMAPDDGARDGS